MIRLPVSQIRLDGGTQPREELDPVVVGEYAEAMKRGDKFPPVDVVYDGDWYWLTDGFHRVKSAKLNSSTSEIEANVTQGTQQDAQWLSLAANQKHGLRRSTKDKQRAIIAALKHPAGVDKSNRAIAEYLGVDHVTVGTMREKLIASGEIHQIEKVEVRRGDSTFLQTVEKAKPAVKAEKVAPSWFMRLDPQLFYPYRAFGKMLVEEGFESIEKAKRDPRYAMSYSFMSGHSLQNMPEMWEFNRVEPAGEPSREHLALLKKMGIKVDPYIPKAAPVAAYVHEYVDDGSLQAGEADYLAAVETVTRHEGGPVANWLGNEPTKQPTAEDYAKLAAAGAEIAAAANEGRTQHAASLQETRGGWPADAAKGWSSGGQVDPSALNAPINIDEAWDANEADITGRCAEFVAALMEDYNMAISGERLVELFEDAVQDWAAGGV